MQKSFERRQIVFATYFKNADDSKTEELGPFILDKHMVTCNESGCIWNVYTNLFDENLVSIVDHENNQNSSYTVTTYGYYRAHRESYHSNITLNKVMFSTEVILKMPAERRLELLQREFLDVADILDIYDFICQNKETLGFKNPENQNQKQKVK